MASTISSASDVQFWQLPKFSASIQRKALPLTSIAIRPAPSDLADAIALSKNEG